VVAVVKFDLRVIGDRLVPARRTAVEGEARGTPVASLIWRPVSRRASHVKRFATVTVMRTPNASFSRSALSASELGLE
jgi:hypothetical protein